MPSTMFNWLTATSKPRRLAGAISVIYIGQTTDAPPTATPPSQRKKSSAYQFHARAQPSAAITNSTASIASTGRRPHQSAGRPTRARPTTVPSSALDTVNPRRLSLSMYTWRKASVVPEITAVSKPNSSDPRAATTALITRIPPPPLLRFVVVGDSVVRGVCMLGALVVCRHRAAILTGGVGCSNLLMRRPFCGAKLPSQARRSAGSTPRCLDLSQATNELETRQLLARCSGGTGVLLGRLGLPSAPVPTACAGGPQFCALTARIFVLACCAMEYVNLG